MAEIIDGKKLSQELTSVMSQQLEQLRAVNVTPGLAVILVGEDPASQVYVNSKSKKAKELGFLSIQKNLPASTSQAQLLETINEFNQDTNIHGILVQLPLPAHIDPAVVIQAISPDKDVDAFTYVNVGKLVTGSKSALTACTPSGVMLMIQQILGEDLSGLNALVVGRSNIVGKPMASMLLNHRATVTIAHRQTTNLPELCKNADILVVAVGKPALIKGEWIKKDAIVIDVGINRITKDDKSLLVGDVDFEEAAKVVKAITPVPGGVGPMTIAMLMANTITAALTINNLPAPEWNKLLTSNKESSN